jgi:NAD(P)-dependent dehydrogenase (short-subunit alcohol dehydrogenase family)
LRNCWPRRPNKRTRTWQSREPRARALAVDLKPIRVNCVTIGAVHIEHLASMAAVNLSDDSPPDAAETKLQAMLALFRSKTLTGTVAEAYLWLMRDRFMTGACVHSNGGYLLV